MIQTTVIQVAGILNTSAQRLAKVWERQEIESARFSIRCKPTVFYVGAVGTERMIEFAPPTWLKV